MIEDQAPVQSIPSEKVHPPLQLLLSTFLPRREELPRVLLSRSKKKENEDELSNIAHSNEVKDVTLGRNERDTLQNER